MAEVHERLAAGGTLLMFFGTSGDIDHLYSLIRSHGFLHSVLNQRGLVKDGVEVTYFAFRVTRDL